MATAKQNKGSTSSKKGSSSKAKKEVPVELGYIEEQPAKWKLKSAMFPSKFGGLPSWLDLKNVPKMVDLKCSSCDGPTRFLLQVYAPQDNPESFHRTIFIFVCSQKRCCVERNSNKNFVTVRCQLPVGNDYYSSDPPKDNDQSLAEIDPRKFGVLLCRVCAVQSVERCSVCKKAHYCGKEHQLLHWHKGHKEECKTPELLSDEPKDDFCFEELEIVIETEVIPKQSNKDKTESERLNEFEQLVSDGKSGTLEDSEISKDMLEAASYKSDKAFNKFKKRIAYSPEQILRYDRGGKPLWVSPEHMAEKADIPLCPYCNGPRTFEFQVMPQLLNNVGGDAVDGDLDWGTLAVYTCEKNCSQGPAYKNEFIWKQDFKGDTQED